MPKIRTINNNLMPYIEIPNTLSRYYTKIRAKYL